MSQGTKHDGGKSPLSLIPAYSIRLVADVLAFGAKKYGAWNWAQGIETSRLLDAALRHIYSECDREDNDPETNLPHAAHAVCMLLFYIWMKKFRPDLDDRGVVTPPTLTSGGNTGLSPRLHPDTIGPPSEGHSFPGTRDVP